MGNNESSMVPTATEAQQRAKAVRHTQRVTYEAAKAALDTEPRIAAAIRTEVDMGGTFIRLTGDPTCQRYRDLLLPKGYALECKDWCYDVYDDPHCEVSWAYRPLAIPTAHAMRDLALRSSLKDSHETRHDVLASTIISAAAQKRAATTVVPGDCELIERFLKPLGYTLHERTDGGKTVGCVVSWHNPK